MCISDRWSIREAVDAKGVWIVHPGQRQMKALEGWDGGRTVLAMESLEAAGEAQASVLTVDGGVGRGSCEKGRERESG